MNEEELTDEERLEYEKARYHLKGLAARHAEVLYFVGVYVADGLLSTEEWKEWLALETSYLMDEKVEDVVARVKQRMGELGINGEPA